jgi:ABC-2 type transport system ATP-binding protein
VETLIRNRGLEPGEQVGKLSVGQRQRLAAILALGHNSDLLILDEPVASLDPAARRQFIQELIEIGQDERHAILFSTHIMSDVERVASHVAIMTEGVVSYFGELDELKEGFKRVRLSRAAPFPANWACPEAVRQHVKDSHAVLTIDCARIDPRELGARCDAEVLVDDLNLEEIFLELCGPGVPVERISAAPQEAGR